MKPTCPSFWFSEYTLPTEAQFAKIGQVIAGWSIVDNQIDALLGALLGVGDFPMRAITERLTNEGRKEALASIVAMHSWRYAGQAMPEELREALKSIVNRYEKLKSFRNSVAHLCWIRSSDDAMFCTALTSKEPVEERIRRNESAGKKPPTLSMSDGKEVSMREFDERISEISKLGMNLDSALSAARLIDDKHLRWEIANP